MIENNLFNMPMHLPPNQLEIQQEATNVGNAFGELCENLCVCASQQHPAVGAVELQSAQYTEAQYTEGSGFYKWHTDGSWTEFMAQHGPISTDWAFGCLWTGGFP